VSFNERLVYELEDEIDRAVKESAPDFPDVDPGELEWEFAKVILMQCDDKTTVAEVCRRGGFPEEWSQE
jgi:hypothetical protein